ncbi:DUF5132 domain-containing protein [Archangium sp.]|uniref:DUF5132 domain-containing protein n=1 Tax=Archangium sp. TaxID=1872627 RepID=UPI002D63E50E|nr:DUF5132 domain-containing protein [Archangium sp.]HYO57674.1 DUF5132 domain-containing protein [Archangium sp.]
MSAPIIAFVSFFLGVTTSAMVDPESIRKKIRPLAKSTLKNGIAVGREIRRKVTRLAEDLDDLVAEVMTEQAEEGGTEPPPREEKRSGPGSTPPDK